MLFDYLIIDVIVDFVFELFGLIGGCELVVELVEVVSDVELVFCEDIVVIGLNCRFLGVEDVCEFWVNFCDGIDLICEILNDCWDVDVFYDFVCKFGKMYLCEGGYFENIGDFDVEFFNVFLFEVCWIDF